MKWSFLLRWTGWGCLGAALIAALLGSFSLTLASAVLAVILGKSAKTLDTGSED